MTTHRPPSASTIDTLKDTPELFPEVGETTPDSEGYIRPIYRVLEVPVAFYAQDDEPRMAECREDEAAPVVASPVGLVEAAIHLGGLPENSRAARLRDGLIGEKYDEDVLMYLDQINAAVTYDSREESPKGHVDSEGFALVVAALSGDQAAEAELAARYQKWEQAVSFEEHERTKDVTPEALAQAQELFDHIALVQSTKHEVVRDERGDILLMTAGDHLRRSPAGVSRYPRATLHFTLNGEVGSHVEGSWGDTNKLIVTNFGKAVEENGLPYALNTVDTSFDVQPGDTLRLPEPIVITPDSESDVLYLQNGADITYKLSGEYTPQERSEYATLTGLSQEDLVGMNDEDIAKGLRTYALSQAMMQRGAQEPTPITIGGMESSDSDLDAAIRRAAQSLGTHYHLHRFQPNFKPEQHFDRTYEVAGIQVTDTLSYDVSLAGQRMFVANGYLAPEKRNAAAMQESQEEEL